MSGGVVNRILALSLGLILALAAGPAVAHRGSESQLTLTLQGRQLSADWEIGLHDLAPADQPGAAPDDLTAAQAWLAQRPALADSALARLHLDTDGQACSVSALRRAVVARPPGLMLRLQWQGHCADAPRQLTVDYRLLFDTDPRHQGLLKLQAGTLLRPAVFTADSPTQVFSLRAPSRWERAADDLRSGVWHIWTGFDHLLFLLCLLLPAVLAGATPGAAAPTPNPRPHPLRPVLLDVLQVVTAFTVAHSITLSAAALHWVSLPSRLTESMIAASVVLAATLNLLPSPPLRRWQAAFAFGLVHGFGFASAIADMGLSAAGLLPTLLGFNLGVEAGQLAVVAVLLPLAYAVRDRPWYRPVVVRIGSMLIAALALMWLIERMFDLRFMPIH
jgi:hypothetical protein